MAVETAYPAIPSGAPRRVRPVWIRFLVLLVLFVVVDAVFASLSVQAAEHPVTGMAVGIAGAATALFVYKKVVGWLEQRTVSEIALRDLVPQTARGVALGSGLFSLAILLIFVCGGYRAEWGSAEDMVATLGLMTAIATCEELLFRGVLFRLVEERAGTVVAAVASSAIFGGIHLINPQATVWGAAALAIEMGLLTAGCFALTRSLWLPIGFHLGWNFAQSGIFGTTVSGSDGTVGGLLKGMTSGPTVLSGGEFGPEASVFAVVLGGVAGCVMLVAAWKRGRFVQASSR